MKEDYLWDKNGQDFEIERLENALKTFRYQETAPPVLPANIVPFEKKNPRGFFRLSFALAGFAVLMIVCFSFWLEFSHGKIEVAKNSPETLASPISETIPSEISVQPSKDLIVERLETPQQSIKQNVVKISKIVATNIRSKNLATRNVEAKKPAVKLTSEEKYAYDQLMLALSITSSKLKLVSDKVEGVEEKPEVREIAR